MRSTYIGAIDQGTSSSRFILFDSRSFDVVVRAPSVPVKTFTPAPGWAEQHPEEILLSVKKCMGSAFELMQQKNIPSSDVIGIGLTNQRETIVAWDRLTGEALAPAIVWFDTRTKDLADRYSSKLSSSQPPDYIQWLLENNRAVQEALSKKTLAVGTVDSWLMFKLLNVFSTDVTNASRTSLMNIMTLEWDPDLIRFFDLLPLEEFLPAIKSNCQLFGYIQDGPFKECPVTGVMGDQQASLLGHQCFDRGQTKATIGTGSFLMMNTGQQPVFSTHGLLTTMAFCLGSESPPIYALEGSIAMGGKLFDWIANNLRCIDKSETLDEIVSKCKDSGGVVFLTNFTGALAPYWRDNLTGLISGLTLNTDRSHVCRAAMESLCIQIQQIVSSMEKDVGVHVDTLRIDGGASVSRVLMQVQADVLQRQTEPAPFSEMTSLGVAMAASIGCEHNSNSNLHFHRERGKTYHPLMSPQESLRLSWTRRMQSEHERHISQ